MVLMVAIVATVSAFAQMSRSDKYKIAELDKLIAECRSTIAVYEPQLSNLKDCSAEIKKLKTEYDSLSLRSPGTSYGKNLKKQAINDNRKALKKLLERQDHYNIWSLKVPERDSLVVKIQRYQAIKEIIINSYVTSTASNPLNAPLSTEMSSYTEARNLRGINVERERRIEKTEAVYADLDIKKLQNTNVIASATDGYKGIIQNFCVRSRIKFDFYRVNAQGVQESRSAGSFLTYPGQKVEAYLLPGNYVVEVYREGRLLDKANFPVTAALKSFFGEQTHWFAAREGY